MGLRTNPSLKGKQIDVTGGTLAAYFSHPGMTGTTGFALSGGGTTPPPGGTSPYDSTYYAPAIGLSGTDLRPEDVTVNSTRGNKDFDLGGTAVSQCSDCWTDGDSFEPRDSVKGDVARMLFYMAIRYEGDDGWANSELNDSVNGATAWHGKISVLLQWNAEDPVSAFEMRRNDVIWNTYQHNRNPFIDHPEWAQAVFG